MRSIREDFIRAEKIVESCRTADQLRAAQLYAGLTIARHHIVHIDGRALVIALLRGRLNKSIQLTRKRINGVRV